MRTLRSRNKRSSSDKPVIGITLGDPAGIGPEVVAKALAKPSIRKLAHFKIIGDQSVYKKYSDKLHANCEFIDVGYLSDGKLPAGKMSAKAGAASLDYLYMAVNLLKQKEITGLVTAPVCKEAICQSYPKFQGHTEFLAEAFDQNKVGMLFVAGNVKTIICTRHIPLINVPKAITTELVYDNIDMTYKALQNFFRVKKPVVGVCGLNPHAGEGGTIGLEEINHIIPAVKKARRKGWNVQGPLAADTIFTPKVIKGFDVIVAMYHDQGLVGIKTVCFDKLVNLTINLPFIRTSPSHGTAFTIAGKNQADPTSMCEAIKLAANLDSSSPSP